MTYAVLTTATIGWVLIILSIPCLFFGIVGGIVKVLREAFPPKGEATVSAIPGLGELIGALAKAGAWGLLTAVGLILLVVGLTLVGVDVLSLSADETT